jgi:hypothetical protein
MMFPLWSIPIIAVILLIEVLREEISGGVRAV